MSHQGGGITCLSTHILNVLRVFLNHLLVYNLALSIYTEICDVAAPPNGVIWKGRLVSYNRSVMISMGLSRSVAIHLHYCFCSFCLICYKLSTSLAFYCLFVCLFFLTIGKDFQFSSLAALWPLLRATWTFLSFFLFFLPHQQENMLMLSLHDFLCFPLRSVFFVCLFSFFF